MRLTAFAMRFGHPGAGSLRRCDIQSLHHPEAGFLRRLEVGLRRCLEAALLLVALIVMAGQAQAATAQEQLAAFVSDVHSASGSFMQITVGPQGQTRPAQSGSFTFERPGRFVWDVIRPYSQRIVSDGREVFQFDPDLNQVTVRKVDQAIGASPASILFGNVALEQAFDVTALPDRDDLAWLRAKPRGGEAGFTSVDLGFRDGLPARIVLLDAFGQTTKVEFSGLKRNPALAPETFKFVAPAGADVVRMQ